MYLNLQQGAETKIDSMKSIIMLILIMVFIINSFTVVKALKMIRTIPKNQMIMKIIYSLETHQGRILMIFKDKKKSLKEIFSDSKKVKRKRHK